MAELSWYCKECKGLSNGCEGNTNPVYSNCIYRKHWLDRGNTVEVIKYNKTGVILMWDYITGSYLVKFADDKIFPYKRDELREAPQL